MKNRVIYLMGDVNIDLLKSESCSYSKKLVYKSLIKFVNKHNILYSSQYGFRSRLSTQHATLEILNDVILSNFDKGQFTFCYF